MASLYVEYGDNTTVNPELGYALLDVNGLVTEINEDIVIQKELLFPYYNKRFLAALNNGTISQTTYDAIINNQGEVRQVYTLNTDVEVDKQLLVDLVTKFEIQNVDTGATAPKILEDIILEGYQVVKKI